MKMKRHFLDRLWSIVIGELCA